MAKLSKRQLTNLKIAGATAVSIFSLATAFTGTIAWFASNQSVEATGMQIKVNVKTEAFNALSIHSCDLQSSNDTKLVFSSTPSVTYDEHGPLNYLDILAFSELNTTQPVLLLFTLKEESVSSNVVISASSENNSYVSEVTAQNCAHFPFSTSVCFRSVSYTSNSFPFDNVIRSSLGPQTSFVTIENAVVSNFTPRINVFEGVGEEVITYVGVIMDYYPQAIEYLISCNLNNQHITNNQNKIDFYCDWLMEI